MAVRGEAEAVGEEGVVAAMRGLAGPRRVLRWQGRQTVHALGLSQRISCKTSLCLATGGFSEGVGNSSSGNITSSLADKFSSSSPGNIVNILR